MPIEDIASSQSPVTQPKRHRTKPFVQEISYCLRELERSAARLRAWVRSGERARLGWQIARQRGARRATYHLRPFRYLKPMRTPPVSAACSRDAFGDPADSRIGVPWLCGPASRRGCLCRGWCLCVPCSTRVSAHGGSCLSPDPRGDGHGPSPTREERSRQVAGRRPNSSAAATPVGWEGDGTAIAPVSRVADRNHQAGT
jgi:hypothetical protein